LVEWRWQRDRFCTRWNALFESIDSDLIFTPEIVTLCSGLGVTNGGGSAQVKTLLLSAFASGMAHRRFSARDGPRSYFGAESSAGDFGPAPAALALEPSPDFASFVWLPSPCNFLRKSFGTLFDCEAILISLPIETWPTTLPMTASPPS